MGVLGSMLMRMFGRPKGILGRLGGIIMARSNREFARWVLGLLELQPNDKVLEVGFGPGVGIQIMAGVASGGYIAGVDISEEMVRQATARNAEAMKAGLVDLRQGSVESLPFEAGTFDKAVAINSLQVWPDALARLQEMSRVMKVGGRIAVAFSRHARPSPPSKELGSLFLSADFEEAQLKRTKQGIWALAIKSR